MTLPVAPAKLGEVDLTMVTLARVLRELRTERGWSRGVVCRRLKHLTGQEIVEQTYGTYEMATREISVNRLIGLCVALGVTPLEVWTKVNEYLRAPAYRRAPANDALVVSLRQVVALAREDLEPARAWARTQLGDGKTHAALTIDALTSLADLCRLEIAELIGALRDARFR